jgi:hypothetical protein
MPYFSRANLAEVLADAAGGLVARNTPATA